ncbi:hypothetical protein LEMLEM_LOCUS11581 [Lemmus lemmus]
MRLSLALPLIAGFQMLGASPVFTPVLGIRTHPAILPPAWSVFSCGSSTFLECLCWRIQICKAQASRTDGTPGGVKGPR